MTTNSFTRDPETHLTEDVLTESTSADEDMFTRGFLVFIAQFNEKFPVDSEDTVPTDILESLNPRVRVEVIVEGGNQEGTKHQSEEKELNTAGNEVTGERIVTSLQLQETDDPEVEEYAALLRGIFKVYYEFRMKPMMGIENRAATISPDDLPSAE